MRSTVFLFAALAGAFFAAAPAQGGPDYCPPPTAVVDLGGSAYLVVWDPRVDDEVVEAWSEVFTENNGEPGYQHGYECPLMTRSLLGDSDPCAVTATPCTGLL